MKYSIVLLLVISFLLTGCFVKKELVDDTAIPEMPNQEQEDENVTIPENQESLEKESQENKTEEENMQSSDENTGSTISTNEQEIIEEYEADLEALFDDLLGSGE